MLTALAVAGHQVLVPITLADRDLDWHQLSDPATPRRSGLAAIAGAASVLVPASPSITRETGSAGAVAPTTGRWPGSRRHPVTAALLFADELVEPRSRPNRGIGRSGAVTPAGWLEPRPEWTREQVMPHHG